MEPLTELFYQDASIVHNCGSVMLLGSNLVGRWGTTNNFEIVYLRSALS